MSRRICVDLYFTIVKHRPDWHHEDDDKGAIKVVMTGWATDPVGWQLHIRNKARREAMANRFKDPGDPLKMVIVRDMWFTGFDAPCLHTSYADKPVRGHGIMQAIARVIRVFEYKHEKLIADYLGLADQLKLAPRTYTDCGGKEETALDREEAVAVMFEKYEVCWGLFHGLDWNAWTSSSASERISVLPAAQERIDSQEDGKEHLFQAVMELSKAFALSVPTPRRFASATLWVSSKLSKPQSPSLPLARRRPR
jgi:type I restriction enzyme R subunit